MDDSMYEIFDDDIKLKIPQTFVREAPRTEIKDKFYDNGTWHEAIVPYKGEYVPINRIPKCDAKTYKFNLDTFQNLSIASIERDESVMVSAHTSCGKTVVAEYAIAQSIKNKQRVVYTSPIKALSNQKYRELNEEFKDVGLMTGDVTINPEASCLVMTTEILRNMLYRGSEVIREVHWIIFDEIHYMRDRERGVVWEETIILLPRHVRMIFLSATIPNAREFTEWITYTSGQIVHIVYTEKRVIPLIHYFQTDDLYLIKDNKFHARNFKRANENTLKRSEIGKSISKVLEKVNIPAVVFSFSRKDCESYAIKISKDFLNEEEKAIVKMIFNNAIASLRVEDRNIPIIEKMLPLLLRGIGIHHSGLLPIIREIVEILFQESLCKVLFATETFSIGLNMPAKTVIFTSLKKFDGESLRLLTSGEYIQMSGRAGRRGLDEQGIVISIISDELSISQAKGMFSSTSDKLNSAFRLTYNMVLNLMRVEGLDPFYILSRSFFHFQAYKNALGQEQKVYADIYKMKKNNIGAQKLSIDSNSEDSEILEDEKTKKDHLEELFDNATDIVKNEVNISELTAPSTELSNLLMEREDFLLKKANEFQNKINKDLFEKGTVVDIIVPRMGAPLILKNCIIKQIADSKVQCFVLTNKDIELRSFPIQNIINCYEIKCKVDIKVFNKKFKAVKFDSDLNLKIQEIEKKIKNIAPRIDLSNCLLCGKPNRACLIECNYIHSDDETLNKATDHIKSLLNREDLQEKLEYLNKLKEIYHMDECRRMIKVLKRLEHLDDSMVLLKGKMASEISSGDELVLTEMIFNSSFTDLSLIDMVALLSCSVCEERSSDSSTLNEENQVVFEIMTSAVRRVCTVMNECNIKVTESEYISKFSYEMMDIIRMWMKGYTFSEICESTSIFEGTIIRTFKRLEELLRQLSNAAVVIGNGDLVNMFTQGIFLIKRDIIFANSLYL